MKGFYNLLSVSFSLTPVIILLLCLNPILKKRYSAKWRYILWIGLSIFLMVPFNYVKKFFTLFKISESVENVIIPLSPAHVDKLSQINPHNLHSGNDSLGGALFTIYIVGLTLYSAYIIFSYIDFRRDIYRWSKFTTSNRIKNILDDEKKSFNIKRNVPILISKKSLSPMLVGLVKPILVLPSEEYTDEELRIIFAHELAHLKRNDIFIKAIFILVSLLHWFNPFVHLMVRQGNKDMEESCDDYVLSGVDIEGRKLYCNVILKMAASNKNGKRPVFSTNIISSKKNLKLRIQSVFDNSKKKRGGIALIAIVVLVMISGLLFSVSGEVQREKTPSQNDLFEEALEDANGNEFTNESKLENDENNITNNIDNNELELGLRDEDDKAENSDIAVEEGGDLPVDDTSQGDDNLPKPSAKVEEIPSQETEIVILDLNLLESQLEDSENHSKSD